MPDDYVEVIYFIPEEDLEGPPLEVLPEVRVECPGQLQLAGIDG